MINLRLKIDRAQMGRFVKDVEKLAAAETYRRLSTAADYMDQKVQANLRSSGLILDRSNHRRKPGRPRLVNSLRSRVDGTPQRFPMRLVLEPKPGVSHAKIATLEKGGKGHHIPTPVRFPSNNRRGKNGKIYGTPVRSPKTRNAYGKNNRTSRTGVNVGSRQGYHFMENAVEDTIAAFRAGRL